MSRQPGDIRRTLVLGGTSEIARATLQMLELRPGSGVVLAGRDRERLAEAAAALPDGVAVELDEFDAREPASAIGVVDRAFAAAPVDVVLVAFGVLSDQAECERLPQAAVDSFTVNLTAQAGAVMAAARLMRAQGSGVIVVLSSVAAVRPRRANFVYGAGKAGLDALARGLEDALHGTGVRVVLVRPGFVIGRMTEGMEPAPMSVTPDDVGRAVAAAICGRQSLVWVPSRLRLLAGVMRVLPRPLWRRMPR
jgi:decaprenylphospho-beta-D-erythro-pentofuranosid-2-ulose 2-reductase